LKRLLAKRAAFISRDRHASLRIRL
jgi:hypothetical protein